MGDKVVSKNGWNYTIIENEVLERNDLDIYEKMLYIALKRFANIQTNEAFPGVKRAAEYGGMSERKARNVIKDLEAKGFLSIERRTNKTNIYTLNPTPGQHAGHAHGAGGGAHGAGGVVHTVQGGGAHGAGELKKQELKKYELKKHNDILSDSENQTMIPYEEIVDHLNKVTNAKYRSTTRKTKDLIKARWNEGFVLDDFKVVIDHKSSQWLNSKMEIYLRPNTLFGSKFEGYLNEVEVQSKGAQSTNEVTPGITW